MDCPARIHKVGIKAFRPWRHGAGRYRTPHYHLLLLRRVCVRVLGWPDHSKAFKDNLVVLSPFTANGGGDTPPVAAVFTLPTIQGQVVFALITSEGSISAREGGRYGALCCG